MQLGKKIRSIMGEPLKELGFEYRKGDVSCIYEFIRPEDGYEERIGIQRGAYGQYLFVRLGFTIRGSLPSDLCDFSGVTCPMNFKYTEENIDSVLQEITVLLLQHINRCFEGYKPIKTPPLRWYERLEREMNKLYDSFAARYRFSKDINTCIEQVMRLILEQSGTVEENEDFVLGAAAFCGEHIRIRGKSKWIWEEHEMPQPYENFKTYVVQQGAYMEFDINPLWYIIRYWCQPMVKDSDLSIWFLKRGRY